MSVTADDFSTRKYCNCSCYQVHQVLKSYAKPWTTAAVQLQLDVLFLAACMWLYIPTFGPSHCGLHCALGGSLGINITSFPLHCSLWNIQSEKHFSAYFQMLWNYLYPILTHFYWIKSFMSLEYKRREIWENKVKNTAKLSYI